MKRKIFLPTILSFFTIMVSLSPVYARDTKPNPPPKVITTANIGERRVGSSYLAVRSSPKLGNNIIGRLKKGDKVTVIEKDKSTFWCRIQYKNHKDAWVACKYLMK